MRAWFQSCPTRVRYLLLAAFLCGVNPKESDNLKFGGAQEGRRKKQRLGTDHDPDAAGVLLLFYHVYLLLMCISARQVSNCSSMQKKNILNRTT